jgi:hypothetical protein
MWQDKLKFSVGDTVKIVRDNKVWNGSVAKIAAITNDARYPYLLHFISSSRPNTVGEKFEWDEESLDRHDMNQRVKLERIIAEKFSHPVDVFYSPTTGCAVVMAPNGYLFRILADGTIDK